ncbi:MAG: hypothetical protein Q7R31_03565 [Candidatus Levybacteria bacterium]|nr:hypothetical protein [Candidatus Levybacteria bacterium]
MAERKEKSTIPGYVSRIIYDEVVRRELDENKSATLLRAENIGLKKTLGNIERTAVDIGLIGFWKKRRLLEDTQARNSLGEVGYTARLREAEEQLHAARRIYALLKPNDSLGQIYNKSVKLALEVSKSLDAKTPADIGVSQAQVFKR